MRYQEPIYIQNNSVIRNRDLLNVNMSSDMCIFNTPLFSVSGASKLNCTGATSGTSYIISSETSIPLTFQFTANTNTFTGMSTSFKYEIYKYNGQSFPIPPVYKSNVIPYSGFTSFSSITQNIPISGLTIDGEYLIKGYYEFNACTTFLNKIGKKVDTITSNRNGKQYGLYNPDLDFYFIAIKQAESPQLLDNGSNNPIIGNLIQQVILPENFRTFKDGEEVIQEGVRTFATASNYGGNFIVTLNGLALSNNLDYTYSGNIITLNSPLEKDDVATVIYTTTGYKSIITDNIIIDNAIVSGATNNQGNEDNYYNTTTDKYELFTSVTPTEGNAIIVMINGATLANGIDYYQSKSDPKRIILEGDLMVGDVIIVAYFPKTSVVNGINTNTPYISWMIDTPPNKVNGLFTLEVGNDKTFTSLYYTGTTDYVIGSVGYGLYFNVSGSTGTNLYYRIKNEKNYETICGNILSTVAYSEVIPITIQSNSINTY